MEINQLKNKMARFKFFSPIQMKLMLGNYVPKTVSDWHKKEHLRKIKNNLYILKDDETKIDDYDLLIAANKIYSPSYISLETAFAFYGLIPEGVYTITSCSTKKTKSFLTKIGNFNYRSIKKSLFFGYQIRQLARKVFRIANLEKSIIDYLYLSKKSMTIEDFHSMRWNTLTLSKLNQKKIDLYATYINSKKVNDSIKNLKQYYHDRY